MSESADGGKRGVGDGVDGGGTWLKVRGSVRRIGAATSKGMLVCGRGGEEWQTNLWATLNVSFDEWVALGQCCLKRIGGKEGGALGVIYERRLEDFIVDQRDGALAADEPPYMFLLPYLISFISIFD